MEARCFPCLRQNDYDDASPLVDPIRRDRASVAATLALEDAERRVAAGLRGGGDSSVYTGAPGIAYYLWRAGDAAGCRALLARRGRARGDAIDCSVACGATGVDLVAALAAETEDEFVARATAIVDRAGVAASAALDADEWLYGRAGYLRALLGVAREARRRGVALDTTPATRRVTDAMLASGRSPRGDLRYRWYGEEYLGAAHGYAGIVYLLLKAGCRDPAVRATADRLLSLETRANYPAVGDETRADLVHWCHGAPGFVYVFAEAHRVYGGEAFRDAALRAAETTWQFGLLKKGPGLCHGISGNGYSLLAAFKLTREPKWLHRAVVFAQCLTNADLTRRSRTPDHPRSLFEGDAGAACFLRDLREDPLRAEFPLFEMGEM